MTTNNQNQDHREPAGIGDDLQITKIIRRAALGGTWLCGEVAGYRFAAKVFPEHARCASYELGTSRISKLGIVRLDDKQTVFNWDRGLDKAAESAETQAVVDFLSENLVSIAMGNVPQATDSVKTFISRRTGP